MGRTFEWAPKEIESNRARMKTLLGANFQNILYKYTPTRNSRSGDLYGANKRQPVVRALPPHTGVSCRHLFPASSMAQSSRQEKSSRARFPGCPFNGAEWPELDHFGAPRGGAGRPMAPDAVLNGPTGRAPGQHLPWTPAAGRRPLALVRTAVWPRPTVIGCVPPAR